MPAEPGSGADPAPVSDAALRRLFEEHGSAVYRMARSVVRDPGLAEDVTQETFIRAWQHHDSYRGDAPIRHWLLRIAHNLSVSTLRTIREESTDPGRLPGQDPVRPDRVVEGRLLIESIARFISSVATWPLSCPLANIATCRTGVRSG